jgi:urease accessory protein
MGRFVFSTSMLVGVLVLGFSSAAFAHPGHGGGFLAGVAHPFTGLDHLLAMVAVGLWASQLGRRAMIALPLVFPAIMAAGAMLGMNGIMVPGVEIAILTSVVVLGAVVALDVRASLAVSVIVVGLFAMFHGYAHGVEIPAATSPLLYGFGFVAATLALHGFGIALGVLVRRPLVMRTAGGAIAATGLLLFVA